MTALEKNTPDRILNTAEALFAEHGIAGVSLRKIIKTAGVNIAAIHYHFGSKDELVKAVFRRRIHAVNEKRLASLAQLKEVHREGPIPITELMRAFLSPVFDLGQDATDQGKAFFRLIARAHAEPEPACQEVLINELKSIVAVFMEELGISSPHLTIPERALFLAFSAGAMVQAVLLPLKPLLTAQFGDAAFNGEPLFNSLISFCTGGMSLGSEQ